MPQSTGRRALPSPAYTMSGPPLSPWHVVVATPETPAQSMFDGSNWPNRVSAAVQSAFVRSGMNASLSVVEPLPGVPACVQPQPAVFGTSSGETYVASGVATSSGGAVVATERCRSATSIRSALLA